jgi:sialic acid synthase SpsE
MRAWQALGEVRYGPSAGEKPSLQFRRSLYLSRDVRAGEALSAENVAVVRPGFGLHPRYYEQLMGLTVRRDAPAGTPLTWDLIGR